MTTVVAFPMLLDRDVGLGTAVQTSIRAALANPVPIAAWGLVVIMPVLCHAAWDLYRKLKG